MAIIKQHPLLSMQKQSRRSHAMLVTCSLISALTVSACQTVPTAAPSATTAVTPATTATPEDDGTYTEDYPIEPYTPSEDNTTTTATINDPQHTAPPSRVIIIQPPMSQPLPPMTPPVTSPVTPPVAPPALPSHSELLERARQNSVQRQQQASSNNSNLPAFRNLMQAGISQLSAGNLTAAEGSFTRAQRLAPKSSAVYFYLAQVALKKNQPRKAEAMARRGLSVAQDSNRRRALWQIILRSGQLQNNARVIREAQQALR